MYHRFEENKYPSTNIRLDDFKTQLKLIKEAGFNFVNPKKFEEELKNNLDRQSKIKDSLKEVESSLPWIWGESYGIPEIRKQLIKSILPHYGVAKFDENVIEDLLEKID